MPEGHEVRGVHAKEEGVWVILFIFSDFDPNTLCFYPFPLGFARFSLRIFSKLFDLRFLRKVFQVSWVKRYEKSDSEKIYCQKYWKSPIYSFYKDFSWVKSQEKEVFEKIGHSLSGMIEITGIKYFQLTELRK